MPAQMIKPLLDFCVIKRDKAEDASKGGILFPELAKSQTDRGAIMSIGPGYFTDIGNWTPTTLKPGQRVVFSKHGGYSVFLTNENGVEEEFTVLREFDLFASIEEIVDTGIEFEAEAASNV